MKKIALAVVAAALLMTLLSFEVVAQEGYTITQLTDNDYLDVEPIISDGQVFWEGDDGNDRELFYWNGTETIQVTENDYDDAYLSSSGGEVVWCGYCFDSPEDIEVFYWNGGEIIQLTDNDYDDTWPDICAGEVVWMSSNPIYSYYSIYYWDGATTIQIAVNCHFGAPKISNGEIIWAGYDGNEPEIFYWDGTQTTQLTDNDYYDVEPEISDGEAVWAGYDGNDHEIFYWNGGEIIQITDNDYDDYGQQVSGGCVAWFGQTGGTRADVFFWDGTEIIQLTDDECWNVNVQISAGEVVWESWYPETENADIFLWNGTETIQLTDSEYVEEYPKIDAGEIVWRGFDGNDIEIFIAQPTGSSPSEQIEDILDYFDNSVEDGSLTGDGPGNSAEHRLNALRNMIESAGYMIEQGQYEEACQQLRNVYRRVDGQPRPPDFATGEAASQLAELVLDLMADLGCQ